VITKTDVKDKKLTLKIVRETMKARPIKWFFNKFTASEIVLPNVISKILFVGKDTLYIERNEITEDIISSISPILMPTMPLILYLARLKETDIKQTEELKTLFKFRIDEKI